MTMEQTARFALEHLRDVHGVRRVGSLNESDIGRLFHMNWEPPIPPEKIVAITHTVLKTNVTTVHEVKRRNQMVWPHHVCQVTDE